MLALVVICQYHSIDPLDRGYRAARLILNMVTYAIALIFFVTIYSARLRSIISATGVLLVSGVLTLELLRKGEDKVLPIWLYAGIAGILMGELTWALNYCAIDARVGGAFLLLIFYVLTGLAQQYLWHRLNRRVVIEFSIVCASGLLILSGLIRAFPT